MEKRTSVERTSIKQRSISSKARGYVPLLLSLLAAVLMVLASELTGQRELIFPEITAVAIGMLDAPVQTWNTTRPRLWATITLCAFAGIGVVRFVNIPLIAQIILGFVVASLVIALFRTDFLPAVSACILPIVLGTRTLLYVASVVVMTGIILLMQIGLERVGMHSHRPFFPVRCDRSYWLLRLKQLVVIAVICAIPAVRGAVYFIVPPLFVAFLEMSKPGSKVSKGKAVGLIIAGAFIGVASRYLLTVSLGWPLTVSAMISVLFILLIMKHAGTWFPPAGAIATLPSLIPAEGIWFFPFEVAVGAGAFALAAALLFKTELAGDPAPVEKSESEE